MRTSVKMKENLFHTTNIVEEGIKMTSKVHVKLFTQNISFEKRTEVNFTTSLTFNLACRMHGYCGFFFLA